jgi:hypothetical protein
MSPRRRPRLAARSRAGTRPRKRASRAAPEIEGVDIFVLREEERVDGAVGHYGQISFRMLLENGEHAAGETCACLFGRLIAPDRACGGSRSSSLRPTRILPGYRKSRRCGLGRVARTRRFTRDRDVRPRSLRFRLPWALSWRPHVPERSPPTFRQGIRSGAHPLPRGANY